jgi:ABC-type transport system involved in multi-copper enzyme maturation permease subunit
MAIFQKAYQGYSGPLTPPFSRTLVIFRYALADVFQNRFFVAFFFMSLLLPLLLICGLYVYYNLDLLLQFEVVLDDLVEIDANFFLFALQIPQNILIFVMVLAIGPAMISPDIRNNAMPLYLSRPINKSSYILGKLLVLIFIGSLISWIPGLLVIFLQAFLGGNGWLWENIHIPLATIAVSLTWMVSLSLLAFAVSAFVKWKAVARMVFFGIILFASIFGGVIEEIFGGWGGYIVNLYAAQEVLMTALYDADSDFLGFVPKMPMWIAVLQFLSISLFCLVIIMRRIRAFQVVS